MQQFEKHVHATWKLPNVSTQNIPVGVSPKSTEVAHKVHPICTESSPDAVGRLWWAHAPQAQVQASQI